MRSTEIYVLVLSIQRIYGMSQGGRNLRCRARCHRKWRVQLCYRGDTSERRRTHHRTRNTTATDADLPERSSVSITGAVVPDALACNGLACAVPGAPTKNVRMSACCKTSIPLVKNLFSMLVNRVHCCWCQIKLDCSADL